MLLHVILVLGALGTAGFVVAVTRALLRRDRADGIARWAGDRHGDDDATSGTLRNSSRGGRT